MVLAVLSACRLYSRCRRRDTACPAAAHAAVPPLMGAASAPPARQVTVALHLDQARDGALELEGAVAVGVELLRRRGGGADEVAVRLIERVDEGVESRGLVAPLPPKLGDAFDDEAVESLAQRQIVGGAMRLAAEIVKVEPCDVLGGARHDDKAALHQQCLARRRGVAGEVGEGALERAIG